MNSEEIILNAYKEGRLTLTESLQLLRDIRSTYQWVYPTNYPTTTYEKDELPKYEVTCTDD